jgi:predicted acyltransferase (DUF342 family)
LTQIKVKVQLVVRNDMHVHKHERLSNVTLAKDQLVVRQDMDVNEQQRLSNVTLRYKLR